MDKKEEHKPCRVCRRAWEEYVSWSEYDYCGECAEQLESFSSHQEDIIQKLTVRIALLEGRQS